MPKVVTEARTQCPELIEAIKLVDQLAYTRNYGQVFADLIDWMIWQHLLQQNEEDPLAKYKESGQKLFLEIWKVVYTETKKRVGLWNNNKSDWYDPLGRMYQCITSKNKSSIMGQFFTPEPVVDFMTQIVNTADTKEFIRVLDPACGSGRMGLATAAHAMAGKSPCWVSMIDLDPICVKMSALNMCFHGFVGEVLCMNGLDIKGDTYRFGYRIQPLFSIIPQDRWFLYQMIGYMKTGQNAKKQYVLIPISYDQSYIKEVNDQLLKEYEERLTKANEEEKEAALQELQDKVKARMKGTLFEKDEEMLKDIKLPSEMKSKKKKREGGKLKDGKDEQLNLFW